MKRQAYLIGFFFLILGINSYADPVVKLNQLMTSLATLQADFNLEIRNQSTNELIDSNAGKLTVKRPGFFHVHTREPFEQLLISDQKVIWSYDVELEQATRDNVDERLQQTPFLLLSGDADAIRKNFNVQEPTTDGVKQQFHLSPVDPGASYDNIELRFEDKVLTAMLWTNSLGEKAQIEFSAISVNQAVEDSMFQFQPPPSIDVVINEN